MDPQTVFSLIQAAQMANLGQMQPASQKPDQYGMAMGMGLFGQNTAMIPAQGLAAQINGMMGMASNFASVAKINIPNKVLNVPPPIGMSQAQLELQTTLSSHRGAVAMAGYQHGVHQITGGRLSTEQEAMWAPFLPIASQLPIVGSALRTAMGYDVNRLSMASMSQAQAFLEPGRFLGEDGDTAMVDRYARLMQMTVKSAGSIIDGSVFRDEAGNIRDSMRDAHQSFGGRRDRLYTSLAALQKMGASDIFDSTGALDAETGSAWVESVGSMSHLMGTSDPRALGKGFMQFTSGGDISKMDPNKVKDSVDNIRKMAQFLGVSSEQMMEAASSIQEMIEKSTGMTVGTSHIARAMAGVVVQGSLAGLTAMEQKELMGYHAERMTSAMGSETTRKLYDMALSGDAWAMDVINNQTTITAHDVHSRYAESGLTRYNDLEYLKAGKAWNPDISDKVDAVITRSAFEERGRNFKGSLIIPAFEGVQSAWRGTVEDQERFDRLQVDAAVAALEGVIGVDRANVIRNTTTKLRSEGRTESQILADIWNNPTLLESDIVEGQRGMMSRILQDPSAIPTADQVAMRHFQARYSGLTGIEPDEFNKIMGSKDSADKKWSKLQGKMDPADFVVMRRRSEAHGAGFMRSIELARTYNRIVESDFGGDPIAFETYMASEAVMDSLVNEYTKEQKGPTEKQRDPAYWINKLAQEMDRVNIPEGAKRDLLSKYGSTGADGKWYADSHEDIKSLIGGINEVREKYGMSREQLNQMYSYAGIDPVKHAYILDSDGRLQEGVSGVQTLMPKAPPKTMDEHIGEVTKALIDSMLDLEGGFSGLLEVITGIVRDPVAPQVRAAEARNVLINEALSTNELFDTPSETKAKTIAAEKDKDFKKLFDEYKANYGGHDRLLTKDEARVRDMFADAYYKTPDHEEKDRLAKKYKEIYNTDPLPLEKVPGRHKAEKKLWEAQETATRADKEVKRVQEDVRKVRAGESLTPELQVTPSVQTKQPPPAPALEKVHDKQSGDPTETGPTGEKIVRLVVETTGGSGIASVSVHPEVFYI